MIRFIFLLVLSSSCFAIDADSLTLGDIGTNLTHSFKQLGQLILATAYITGIGFGIAAVFKFKQVKDNPTQIPISTPFALLGVSAMLVFLPGIFKPTGRTLFGANAQPISGGFEGKSIEGLPGTS